MVNLYPGCCVPQERAPYPLRIGSWLGPGASLGTLARDKYFASPRNWMPDSSACGNYTILAPRWILSHLVTRWSCERQLVGMTYSLTCCESVGCLIFSHLLKFITVASEYNWSVSRQIGTLIWQALRVQSLALRPPHPPHYYSTAFFWNMMSCSLEAMYQHFGWMFVSLQGQRRVKRGLVPLQRRRPVPLVAVCLADYLASHSRS